MGKTQIPKNATEKLVRELYRHRQSFRDYQQRTGHDVIEYQGYLIAASELDLNNLKILTPRQREAFFLNVVMDMQQSDVAEMMGCAQAVVHQTITAACRKLARLHFPEQY